MKNVWPLQRDCMTFYGDPRRANWFSANTVRIAPPWEMRIGKTPVKQLTVHKKCAESMLRVFKSIWEAVGKSQAEINKRHYNIYDGIYNLRAMRGNPNNLSIHSYAAAIDMDAANNPFNSKRHLFQAGDLIVVKFEEESWVWGGRWSSPDSMHFQAARVR